MFLDILGVSTKLGSIISDKHANGNAGKALSCKIEIHRHIKHLVFKIKENAFIHHLQIYLFT